MRFIPYVHKCFVKLLIRKEKNVIPITLNTKQTKVAFLNSSKNTEANKYSNETYTYTCLRRKQMVLFDW